MKKTILIFAAAFAFAACQKESVMDNTPVSASEIVFDLDVTYGSATKATKKAWADGDKLFIFFKDVTSGYATVVYDKTAGKFTSAQLNGTVTIDDLSESGTLTAIYLPYGNDATPTYRSYGFGTGWTFNKNYTSYFLTATHNYTLTKASGITTLTATLNMAVPYNFVQFFVPDAEATGSIRLACNAVKVSGLMAVSSDGTVTEFPGGHGAFMTAYAATVGEEKGYYASGKLSGAGTEYYIAIEKGGKFYDYGIHTASALASNAAIKLSAINEVGPQKYTKNTVGGKTWATVNVGASRPWQYESSSYQYDWMGVNDSDWTMIDSGSGEGMPEDTEFDALYNNCYHNWITINNVNGCLIIDKTTKGYMFLPASGYNGGVSDKTSDGYYWSRTKSAYNGDVRYLRFWDNSLSYIWDDPANNKYSVRPIKK